MDWIIAHWKDVAGVVTGIIAVASIIAKLTPTQTDDIFIGKVLRLIDILAINNKPTTIIDKLK